MENYIVIQSRLHNLNNDYLVITFELANNTESCDCSLSHCLIRQDHGFSSPHELHQLPVGLVVLSLQEQLVVSVEGYRF